MKFLIITHVEHGKADQYFAYAPYVREMNIWTKFADEVTVVAPCSAMKSTMIHSSYNHPNLRFIKISSLNFQNFSNCVKSLLSLPLIFYKIFSEMKNTDHIHLRCPGNIGLLGCIAQIFFPSKQKSAKYAGNWDPNSKQPISYKVQKWILSNTFLTKNMNVLVYGKWPNQSKNIVPFFTASYSEQDKVDVHPRDFRTTIKFIFVGTLAHGKRPLYAMQIINVLHKRGLNITIDFYGDGQQRNLLEDFISFNKLENIAILHGNVNEQILRNAYRKSHFLILASKSEGWPKAVAEAMFWGVVPISSAVSCVPQMLDQGNRGILIENNLEKDVHKICVQLNDFSEYEKKVWLATEWSREFTLELFQNKIALLLNDRE